ncbi:unnamed protein product, partial [marine sediment metagenome]
QFANTTVFETANEKFNISITFDSSKFPTSSAVLNYNGTNYAGTKTGVGDNLVFTRTLDIPTTEDAQNRIYFWNVTLNNGSDNSFVTALTDQNTTNITFQECGAGVVDTIFLNITFQDEDLGDFISASVPSSTFDFWLGNGDAKELYSFNDSSDNAQYNFCGSPNQTMHTGISFNYEKSPGFAVRNYAAAPDLSNTTTHTTLQLSGTANGAYITLQILTKSDNPISGVNVQVERKISGAWTVVGNGVSDDAGQVVFFLDQTLDHKFTITHDDY